MDSVNRGEGMELSVQKLYVEHAAASHGGGSRNFLARDFVDHRQKRNRRVKV